MLELALWLVASQARASTFAFSGEMKHMAEIRQCTLCHRPGRPAELVLLDGTPIPAGATHLQCGQCHGLKQRDWNMGLHGKRTGTWRWSQTGQIQADCVSCHEPHAPAFKTMRAEPPPRRPALGVAKSEEEKHHAKEK